MSKAPASTTSNVLAATINAGQSVTFTATVSPNVAGGIVTFLDGTTTLGTATLSAGLASYTSTAFAVGSHSITARYEGNVVYAAATSAAKGVTVNKATTTTMLVVSASPITVGQPLTLTATLAPSDSTGIVTFLDGTTTLGTGTLSEARPRSPPRRFRQARTP